MSIKHPPVSDRILTLFIEKKHNWKSLPPDQVMSMAIELQARREAGREDKSPILQRIIGRFSDDSDT